MYCDYAATTPLKKEVKEYIISILDDFGNPSSVYSLGDTTRQIINTARENVRRFINAEKDAKIVFTPSGSGSNTLAVSGVAQKYDCDIYFSPLLHKSLKEYKSFYDNRGYHNAIRTIPVNQIGRINTSLFTLQLVTSSKSGRTPFVVIEYANSEIGTIQPVKEIIETTHRYGGFVYVDCTGAISSVPIDVQNLHADMIGFSAHKLGALKGCGVLYIGNGNVEIDPIPLIFGAQEYGLVGGTENMIGIAALGKAVENYEYKNLSQETRKIAYGFIRDNGWHLVGDRINRLPNNFYFSIPNTSGMEIMTLLDTRSNIQVSTGSACSAGSARPSDALIAIGVPQDDNIHSYIRVTFHGDESLADVMNVFEEIKEVVRNE